MFNKESLYINAIKYDTQLKLDFKKLNNGEIFQTNNSVFLVNDDILPIDIANKINASQSEVDEAYISTILISDTTKLITKDKSNKLKDCEITNFNADYDIAVLKTTLFETKNFFAKTGVDYIYSAFHIMNLHIEQNVSKNELLIFLFNNRAFILILDAQGLIVFHKVEDLPTFESIKKTHFYENDIEGQKLFDEIYYLELNSIIHRTLEKFYEKNKDNFVEKVTILFNIKQLTNEQVEQLSEELLIKVNYHPINVDEEIFELSKDYHHKRSFINPRKKKKKINYINYIIFLFFLLAFFGLYKLYFNIIEKDNENKIVKQEVNTNVKLDNHVYINSKIKNKIERIFESIAYDTVLKEFVLNKEELYLKTLFLKEDTFITSLKPNLDRLYKSNDATLKILENGINYEGEIISEIPIAQAEKKVLQQEYINDEFMSISRVTEQLRILMPKDTIIKFKSSSEKDVVKFNYLVNMIVQTPKEFFDFIDMLNKELYCIYIDYPVTMTKSVNGIEVEFNLVFNQIKN